MGFEFKADLHLLLCCEFMSAIYSNFIQFGFRGMSILVDNGLYDLGFSAQCTFLVPWCSPRKVTCRPRLRIKCSYFDIFYFTSLLIKILVCRSHFFLVSFSVCLLIMSWGIYNFILFIKLASFWFDDHILAVGEYYKLWEH